MSDCAKGIDCTEASSCDCPGKVDQKKPRQSGSSKMYGNTRVSNRTQFRTEHKKQLQSCTTIPKSAVIHSSELNTQNNYKAVLQYLSQQSYTVQNWTHKIIPIYFMYKHNRTTGLNCWTCLVPNHDTFLTGPISFLPDCIKNICIIPHIICNTLTPIHCHEWHYRIYLLNIWKWMTLIKGIWNGHTQGKHELKKVEMLVF